MIRTGLAVTALLALSACATATAGTALDHPEARSFAVSQDPSAQVDAALASAAANDTRVLLVMGANWCHDSRAFAGWMEQPRFQALVAEHYELVYVNVGMPQTADGHNLDVARRFGLEAIYGTPTVLVLDSDGAALNLDTAGTWRNTASRSADAIHAELTELAAL